MNLKEKLGPINWQFLPTKRYDSADFEAFLKLLPKSVEGRKIRHAVEVRHNSFRTAEFIEVLRSYQAGAVFTDKDQFPQIPDVTSSFVYARLQCASKEEESGYSAEDLDAGHNEPLAGLRERYQMGLRLWQAQVRSHRETFSFTSSMALNQKLPPLPWL